MQINENELDAKIFEMMNHFKTDQSKKSLMSRVNLKKILIGLLLISFAVGGSCYAITNKSLTKAELEDLKIVSKAVSVCEKKSINNIYAELKKKYEFRRLEDLPRRKVPEVMAELEKRNCTNK